MAVSSIDPRPTFDCVTQSTHIDSRVLAADTVETFQAPAGAKYVLFAGTADFYAKIAAASTPAAVPSADTTDGSASELNPKMRTLPGNEAFISLVAPAATIVTLSYYAN